MKYRRSIFNLFLLLMMMITAGCRTKPTAPRNSEVVVSVGDSILTLEDVLRVIPRGLSEDDSVALMQSVIDTWIRKHVLTDAAERRLGNIDEIERLVDEYRTNLILTRYLASLDVRKSPEADKRQIDKYLDAVADSMVLEEPLVKGIYIKVDESEPRLNELREWIRRSDADAVEQLESKGLKRALQYEYFIDRWLAWHEVAGLIPYRFYDADAFLRSTKDFETQYNGSVHLLHISAYLESGDRMPEDYGRTRVAEMLRHYNMTEMKRKLISKLYSREIEEGRLKGGLYDPVTGKLNPVKMKNGKKNE